jgi:hypothetical protein
VIWGIYRQIRRFPVLFVRDPVELFLDVLLHARESGPEMAFLDAFHSPINFLFWLNATETLAPALASPEVLAETPPRVFEILRLGAEKWKQES